MSSQVENLSFNLEKYLSKLTLQPIIHGCLAPPMPPPDMRSSITPLSLAPGGYRRLREMRNIGLAEEAARYFSQLSKADGGAFRGLNLMPKEGSVPLGDGDFNPYVVHSATNVVCVLDRFLLQSAKAILETLDEGMQEWTFRTIHRPRQKPQESQSLDPIVLCRSDASGKRDAVKLIVAALGPWEFAPRDFAEFTSSQRFDDTPPGAWKSREWVNADRMWAYLYDLCLDYQCPYFAVTSHEQWSFGAFSEYYTNAWLTPPLSFDNKPTSIVEIFTYWIHASFGQRNTVVLPKVPTERYLRPEHMQRERELHAKRFLNDGISGAGPDLVSDDLPPAKRQRIGTRGDPNDRRTSGNICPHVEVQHQHTRVFERYRRPKRAWRKYCNPNKRDKSSLTRWKNPSTESLFSMCPSIAPSSAEPLEEKMIPKRKHAAVQRWLDMVATGQEDGVTSGSGISVQPGKWVDALVCDPSTGDETGDLEQISDHTCSSCCPSSPTLSSCSLSSEDLARWNGPEAEDFSNLCLHQWF